MLAMEYPLFDLIFLLSELHWKLVIVNSNFVLLLFFLFSFFSQILLLCSHLLKIINKFKITSHFLQNFINILLFFFFLLFLFFLILNLLFFFFLFLFLLLWLFLFFIIIIIISKTIEYIFSFFTFACLGSTLFFF